MLTDTLYSGWIFENLAYLMFVVGLERLKIGRDKGLDDASDPPPRKEDLRLSLPLLLLAPPAVPARGMLKFAAAVAAAAATVAASAASAWWEETPQEALRGWVGQAPEL
eukprot:290011-Pelagomonas_calceolata.AAC.1